MRNQEKYLRIENNEEFFYFLFWKRGVSGEEKNKMSKEVDDNKAEIEEDREDTKKSGKSGE